MITAVKPVSIQTLVEGLRQLPESLFGPTEPIRRFLQETPVNADSLAPYLELGPAALHSQSDRPHSAVRIDGHLLGSRAGQFSAQSSRPELLDGRPHRALAGGELSSGRQDLQGGSCCLEPTNTVEMNISQPCAVDPADPVHRVVNPKEFNQRAVSLHVYSRPFDTCVVYSPEQGTCGEIKLHFNTEYGKPK